MQQSFVLEYPVDYNPVNAAIRAGYSERTAQVAASRLMRAEPVKRAIAKADKERAEKMGITPERALLHTARIAFADTDAHDVKIKVSEKLKALEMILKCTGAFDEAINVKHTHEITGEAKVIHVLKASDAIKMVENGPEPAVIDAEVDEPELLEEA